MYSDFETIDVVVQDFIAHVTITNPPINLMTFRMLEDLEVFARKVQKDDSVKVILFRSSNPDFFIAHADVQLLQQISSETYDPAIPNPWHVITELFSEMPKISVAHIEGQVLGGGSEFVLGLDMRFGAIGKARIGQIEVALGIIPGGGGCARIPRLTGRARALEIILGSGVFDAETAERYGYINRALPEEELAVYVDRLVRRIASFPAETLAHAKKLIDKAAMESSESIMQEERTVNGSLLFSPETQRRIQKALSLGLQERDVELDGLEKLVLLLESD